MSVSMLEKKIRDEVTYHDGEHSLVIRLKSVLARILARRSEMEVPRLNCDRALVH